MSSSQIVMMCWWPSWGKSCDTNERTEVADGGKKVTACTKHDNRRNHNPLGGEILPFPNSFKCKEKHHE